MITPALPVYRLYVRHCGLYGSTYYGSTYQVLKQRENVRALSTYMMSEVRLRYLFITPTLPSYHAYAT